VTLAEKLSVIIAEPSPLLQEGLRTLLQKSGMRAEITIAANIQQVDELLKQGEYDAVLINPSFVQHLHEGFAPMRRNFDPVKWIGIVYAFFDQELLSQFDGLVRISDNPDKIIALINQLLQKGDQEENEPHQNLSEREIDVLKLLVAGCSNKEIAEKLYISIHTVISHRKNISVKTGIKSVAGLTIFAVAKKLIRLDQVE